MKRCERHSFVMSYGPCPLCQLEEAAFAAQGIPTRQGGDGTAPFMGSAAIAPNQSHNKKGHTNG